MYAEYALPSTFLGNGFAEFKWAFAEFFRHSANKQIPVVNPSCDEVAIDVGAARSRITIAEAWKLQPLPVCSLARLDCVEAAPPAGTLGRSHRTAWRSYSLQVCALQHCIKSTVPHRVNEQWTVRSSPL